MKFPILIALILSSFIGSNLYAQIQCAVDIQIVEGATIEFCEDAPETISGTGGFVFYSWTGPETLSGQTITPNFSGQYILNALDDDGCTSADTITVTIFPNPPDVILSSSGNTLCSNSGTILSLAGTYASYTWSTGENTPTINVSNAGTIDLATIDNNGCSGLSSITLSEIDFDLEYDNNYICNGGTVQLIATGGTSYLWSTSETANSIVISPADTTSFWVEITNGTCSDTLFGSVNPPDEDEVFSLPDVVYLNVGDEYYLTGPAGFAAYSWLPSDQLSANSGQTVIFTAGETQWITLEALHPTGCVLVEPILMVVVDVDIPNGFSPNGDSYNEYFVIQDLDDYTEKKLSVWNRWGDIVLEQDNYQNDWDGTCQTSLCMGSGQLPEGTYFYLLDVHGITFKGYITLKR